LGSGFLNICPCSGSTVQLVMLSYEVQKGPRGTPADFKKIVPDALSAQDWFRFHERYSNGDKISA